MTTKLHRSIYTGPTPIKSIPTSTKGNETGSVMRSLLQKEVNEAVFQVSVDAFLSAFLYPSPNSTNLPDEERYAEIARECVAALGGNGTPEDKDLLEESFHSEEDNSRDFAESSTKKRKSKPAKNRKGPPYSKHKGFKAIRAAADEPAMYSPLIRLMEFVQEFYRRREIHGDESWPKAVSPWPLTQSKNKRAPSSPTPAPKARAVAKLPTPSKLLERQFVDCHAQPLLFKHIAAAERKLMPDLAMLLINPAERHGEGTKVFWKDVKVAIEVKDKTHFDAKLVGQMTDYARLSKLEQFDRNFSFSVTISQEHCRIWRWDTAACYVSAPFNYHEEPEIFIHLIGRLASLDPTTLGFDTSFSNAGRVLASEVDDPDLPPKLPPKMPTTLTIKPNAVRDLRMTAGQEEVYPVSPESTERPIVFLLAPRPLFAAKDLAFCRSTVVWKGWEIVQGRLGECSAIKQNSQDDSRIHEGAFYVDAKGLGAGLT